MGTKNNVKRGGIDAYIPPEDIQFIAKTYPVTTKNFSIALLKARYDSLPREAQDRVEKSLLYLVKGRPYH